MKRNLFGAILIVSTLTLVSYVAKSPANRRDIQQPSLADGSGPIQTCRPGTNCPPDDQLRQMADGSGPIQTCRPGTNCPPDDQLRQMADGSGPIQTCRPGTNCPPDDQLRITAAVHRLNYAQIYAG